MISSNEALSVSRSQSERITQAALLLLQHAIEEARSALTPQEGLYRAYMKYLHDLELMEGLPARIQIPTHELLVELRAALGIDELSGIKVRPSTLAEWRAALLLGRLDSIAANARAVGRDGEKPA